MERPQSTLGLLVHLARTRWQRASHRGRFAAGAALAVLALGGAIGARAALGACCAGSCPSQRAEITASAEPIALDADDDGAGSGCAGAH